MHQVARWNEFGAGDVPEARFFRMSGMKRQPEMRQATKAIIASVTSGRITLDRALDNLGRMAAANLAQDIRLFRYPPNAPSTIAKKGFDNRMIETGHLVSQIDYEVSI